MAPTLDVIVDVGRWLWKPKQTKPKKIVLKACQETAAKNKQSRPKCSQSERPDLIDVFMFTNFKNRFFQFRFDQHSTMCCVAISNNALANDIRLANEVIDLLLNATRRLLGRPSHSSSASEWIRRGTIDGIVSNQNRFQRSTASAVPAMPNAVDLQRVASACKALDHFTRHWPLHRFSKFLRILSCLGRLTDLLSS